LDADTGESLGIAVRATLTVTFGAAKQGLLTPRGVAHVGRLLVDDLGLPEWLIRRYTHPT
jgi:NAD(P)H-hydrate epimerase